MTRASVRSILAVGAMLLLSACGGGGSDSASSGSTTPTPVALTNFAAVTVDGGPAALNTGPDGYTQYDVAYVSVTVCAPGSTTNCQTVDHVQVDTGSVGLRILQSALGAGLLSALPVQSDASGNPVGECYGYVDGYVFGSVRSADVTIGGESVSGMPFQVAGDTGVFSTVPDSCSSGGGANENTVQALGSNGVLGIGVTATDCGSLCETAGGYAAAIYYDCPPSGCAAIITRTASSTAPFQQLPNPVAAFPIDNNGSILSLPTVPAGGQGSVTGTLYFGIGTQSNNALGSATVLTVSPSSSPYGPGLLTATYGGQTLRESFIDSGSNGYYFVDNTITPCQDADFQGYYCPSPSLTLNPILKGVNLTTVAAPIVLYNAQTLLSTTGAALPGIGGNPDGFTNFAAYPNSFDFGLPFFFGRSLYTAIEGRDAGGFKGPYVAF